MESIRILTNTIASFFFMLNLYLLLANRKLKIVHLLIDKSIIFSYISCILSLISIVIGLYNYERIDSLMIIVCIFSLIPILYTITKPFKTNKTKNINVTYNENNIRKLTKEEKKKYKKYLIHNNNKIITIDGKEKLLIYECSLNNIENGDILKTEKRTIDNIEYYFCGTYIKNNNNKKNYIEFIMNIYVILVATYGTIILSNNSLKGQISNDNESVYFFTAILYVMLNLIVNNEDKNKLKGLSLIFYYILYILKIYIFIKLLLIWFI